MVQYYDAQSKNNNKRSGRIYTDLDLFFGKKSSDSDISKVTDIQAVKRSIRNLVLLNVANPYLITVCSSLLPNVLGQGMNVDFRYPQLLDL